MNRWEKTKTERRQHQQGVEQRPEEAQDRPLIADLQLLDDHVLDDRPEPHELRAVARRSAPARRSARAVTVAAGRTPRAGPWPGLVRTSMSGRVPSRPIADPSIGMRPRPRPRRRGSYGEVTRSTEDQPRGISSFQSPEFPNLASVAVEPRDERPHADPRRQPDSSDCWAAS